ncbi:MAG: molybdopterin molybdotransferase MoeA [Dehalococcoidia bacterium]|nr:molybdopterin molybdotransferase MoeA [Dehalococcoidia bacterium]
MISVEEALARILSNIRVLELEKRPVLECLGQVLDEDIIAEINIPSWDNSAMDGYAVQWESIKGAGDSHPQVLKVIGEVAAGHVSKQEVTPGTAIRIMTGAPMPTGADTVVPFEDTDEEKRKATGKSLDEIGVLREIEKGKNIREAGEDVGKGSIVMAKGTVLRPQEIGILASLGYAQAPVIRRPVIAILATGDELVGLGQPLPAGKIYNSNSYSIAAQVLRYGGIPKILGIGADNREDLSKKIALAMDFDMLLTSGGVSMGDYDIVKNILAENGTISFWTVRMKPGKPLAFGVLEQKGKRVPHLGLPGNPVSSMVTFEQFARPAILKMLGKKNFAKPAITAISESRIKNTDGRRVYARATVVQRDGQYYACSTGPQGSGILTSMARANGLIVIPEDAPAVKEGDKVLVQMLDWMEETQ